MPAVGELHIAGCLQVLGDHRRVLLDRSRVADLDGLGQAPMQLGTV